MSYFNEKKYSKFNFGRGSAPDPAGAAYGTPPDLAALKRSLLLRKGRRWKERRGGTEGAAASGPIGS